MTTNNRAFSGLKTLLQEAQLDVREVAEAGQLYELEPTRCGGRRALVLDRKEQGIVIALRVEIPAEGVLRGELPTSIEALALLGALTSALRTQDVEAELIAGMKGLEAVLLSTRLCTRELDAPALNRHLDRLGEIAGTLEPMLTQRGPALIESVLARVRPQFAAPPEQPGRIDAVIVPTFDEQARDRLLHQAGG